MAPPPADVTGQKPLDGGWGWMVVLGAHISIGFAYSTPKALSIFFKPIQEDLEASYSEIAWISSIMLAVMYAGGESPVFVLLLCTNRNMTVIIMFHCEYICSILYPRTCVNNKLLGYFSTQKQYVNLQIKHLDMSHVM